jgi:hypothetical protein
MLFFQDSLIIFLVYRLNENMNQTRAMENMIWIVIPDDLGHKKLHTLLCL